MAYKVFKKGKKYAILNDGMGGYYVVDIMTGSVVSHSWDGTASVKDDLERLETGSAAAGDFADDFYHGDDFTEHMPPSLLRERDRAVRTGRTRADGGGGRLTARDLVGSEVTKSHGTFDTIRMADGTYAYRLGTGEVVGGFKSASGATLSAKRAVEVRSAERLAEMGVDPGQSATDTLMSHYRGRIESVYSQAVREMRSKQGAAMESYERRRRGWEEAIRQGRATREEYEQWLIRYSSMGEATGSMVDQLARVLADADEHAVGMINGYTPRAYAENMNYATYEIEHGARVSTSFTLYDEGTVHRLLEQDRKLLPEAHLDRGRDFAWNRAKVQEAVTQGVLQGESVPEVAKRLEAVAGMDSRSAMRSARTALTGAQNAGRTDAFARAKGMGIQLTQEWQATYDMRTRHSHAVMDGERAEVGERFSNGLMYPGDPEGEPAEVMNCRCTLVPVTQGLDDGGAWRRDVRVGDMSYEEWKEYHGSKMPKTVEQLREEADRLRSEVDQLAERLSEANMAMSPSSVRYHEEELEKAKREVEELKWADKLDEVRLQAQVDRLYDEIAELGARSNSMGFGPEWHALQDEIGRKWEVADELEDVIDEVRRYGKAKFSVQYHTDELAKMASDRERAKREAPLLKARIEGLIPERNRAYAALSERVPFMPDVREKLGDAYADAMEEIVSRAEGRHPEVAGAYRRFSSQLVVKDPRYSGGAHYSPGERGVFVNASEAAAGSVYEAPYQTMFHEMGHMIDNVSYYGTGDSGFSRGLQEVIREDWAAFRRDMVHTDAVSDAEKDRIIVDWLNRSREAMGYNEGLMAYSNVSDIIEGCTGIDHPLGAGHGVEYHTGPFSLGKTSAEFVAEVFDSSMTNEAAYEQMVRIFPNAVRLVERMAAEI